MGGRGAYSTDGKRGGKVTPIDISQYAGWSLSQMENRIRNLSYEELYVFDKDGNLIAGYKGNDHRVSFPHSLIKEEGVTVTHGHPSGSEGYGATFSLQDVQNMALSNWSEHRAVASGKNEYNYIMKRTSKTTEADGKNLYKRIANDTKKIEAEYNAAAKEASSSGLTAAARRQYYTGVLERYYKEVLPEYNFEYIKKKESYNY